MCLVQCFHSKLPSVWQGSMDLVQLQWCGIALWALAMLHQDDMVMPTNTRRQLNARPCQSHATLPHDVVQVTLAPSLATGCTYSVAPKAAIVPTHCLSFPYVSGCCFFPVVVGANCWH